ncbi:hypothetical protein NDU88_004339 [Pleurodeles waltl]|uniref:Uncharacterized protein n=1 Tax=Pleurodeles waltl TaxID=8319 RepID=A0AAV7VJ07_PLEWA|nr:hypothetical protein NDU88_004339 [Pleurodeles waltl]
MPSPPAHLISSARSSIPEVRDFCTDSGTDAGNAALRIQVKSQQSVVPLPSKGIPSLLPHIGKDFDQLRLLHADNLVKLL